MLIAIGTEQGVTLVTEDGAVHEEGLQGRAINHLWMREGAITAAIARDGLYRIDEHGEGRTWEGDARSCAVSPAGTTYVGIEPAMIFRSRDGGGSWRRLDSIDALPTRDEWTFPPPPHQPHVLSIDFEPGAPERVIAGIEVGGVIWSSDGGDTWEERNEGIYEDVHSLRPGAGAGELYAVTGNGFYASADSGRSWERRMQGIDHGYTIGLACHPSEPGEVLVSAGDRPPGMNGRLYRTQDGGRRWVELPASPAGIAGRAPVPFYADGVPCIGERNGAVWRLNAAGDSWELIAELTAAVNCVFSDGAASSVMH